MTNQLTTQFVAHRGYSRLYPENTLLSMEQAMRSGACYIECDIHLTKDCLPVLLHDAELDRVTGHSGVIHELVYEDVKQFSVRYPDKFGDKFTDLKIPLLSDLVELMTQWPKRKVFVEVKRSSIRQFGREFTVQKILEVVQGVSDQVVVISFDQETINLTKQLGSWQTGWVIDEWSASNLAISEKLRPDFLFVDVDCIPMEVNSLPDACWNWALYEIDTPELASTWINRGATFIETNDIEHMLQYKSFRHSGCHE